MARKALSKKLRFEIFKRDSFTCQYCGSHPPAVVLHADHIIPVADGGQNTEDNLITACEACNLGKGARPLDSAPLPLADKAKLVAEKEAQIRGYNEVMQMRRARIVDDAWAVAQPFMEHFNQTEFRKDWLQSIKTFVEKLGVYDATDAMERAVVKRPHSKDQSFRYFCGICWAKIREGA